MALTSKLIVTDRPRMRAKYGQPGWAKIRAAVRELIAADRARGIATRLVLIDGSRPERVKERIDAAYAADRPPDYLMILGAPDVVVCAQLTNPLWTGDPDDDPDRVIASDLPYACDGAYTTNAAAYRGPSRVVGRLPDLVGADTPTYLIALIRRAARWKALDVPRPIGVLAISAQTWRRSTQTSIAALSGAAGEVRTCPTGGPVWPAEAWAAPLMFVNCHGRQLDPNWYGERTAGQFSLPHAVDASALKGVVRPGCVVAAECCYGTMHWDPSSAGGQPSVALALLLEGAVGVFGSSTVAYGPPTGNSAADVITRMFLEGVTGGASIGRAALEARQRYVAHEVSLGPVDLKTLAQFDLLGDPSVHAVAPIITDPDTPAHDARRPPPGVERRRATLLGTGISLDDTVGAVSEEPLARARITRTRFGREAGLTANETAELRIRSFDVVEPDAGRPGARARGARAIAPSAERYHVAFVGRGRRRNVVVVRTEVGAPPSAQRLRPKR